MLHHFGGHYLEKWRPEFREFNHASRFGERLEKPRVSRDLAAVVQGVALKKSLGSRELLSRYRIEPGLQDSEFLVHHHQKKLLSDHHGLLIKKGVTQGSFLGS